MWGGLLLGLVLAVGLYRGWPRARLIRALVTIWALVMAMQIIAYGLVWLPPDPNATPGLSQTALTLATRAGGSPFAWLSLGVVSGVIWLYSALLRHLRLRAHKHAPAPEPAQPAAFSDAELNRYARHIMLREIGGPGQKRLKEARVLAIGAGGLGSPALLYLAAAGVGTIGIIDNDAVDSSNLQRQVIHTDARIGQPKVHSAAEQLRALNPFVEIRPYARRLTEADAEALFADYDLILDGTDNFDTRALSNRVATRLGLPLISGAITQWEGQLSVFDPKRGAPCYACIFPTPPAPGLAPSCAEAGVIAPLPGVIGSMMALEAIKVLTQSGEALRGQMLIYDALYGETRKITLKPNPDCPVCGPQD